MYIKPKKKKNNNKYINKKENFFHLFFHKIGKFITHRIYFMFIPHSKKKTKTLSLPIYSIIIIVLIISLSLLTTFSFLTKNTVLASKTEVLSGSYKDKLTEINSLENIFSSVVTNDYYRSDMSNIASILKVDTNNINFSSNYMDNILLMNLRAEELKKLKVYLDELKANITSKNNALEPIPSILPIDSRYAVISRPYQDGSIISRGIGFETIAGTLIRATASGTVNDITYDKDTGFTITIYHRFGIITRYSGLATSLVSEKMDVKKGEILGNAKTGVFEYELRIATEYVNPLIFTTVEYQ
ncbi:M23 family metallopeptidase [Brachyspira hyodysenteriae]|uniref:M23 family metallopeptidase n=1 Tax=Brachyspira hyodysenteriae TaxID=159 RepID=UPI0022CD9A0C|nr:M23 family metallopeptidase [Brachyspira hyodysenteriae]MCZ9839150.1 M23 family metallopeptidase [Brachyspira hyodysenteriae]MCZ9847769.1 M23 family metallopeptidase [Brachyspira hyodysenteriae]MCZ9851335.1 M23 family metallopeptidase [Brachyspira hyodysenteriae]MCZ9859938.1 M23 family metallopeptidase [Brachyspira hyodysenteriae]MCZ9870448.1 M23 family metallopeptidase [Brachyspira hyodysenteriae]